MRKENVKSMGMKAAAGLIRKISGVESEKKPIDCIGLIYQPKRPKK